MPTHWWVKLGPGASAGPMAGAQLGSGVSGCRTQGSQSWCQTTAGVVGLVPDTAGCRVRAVLKLVSAHW